MNKYKYKIDMENLKLVHLEHDFKVDAKNHVVVCIGKFLTFDGEYYKTVGVARAENEEFDEKKGKQLARARAEKNAFVMYMDHLQNLIRENKDHQNSLEMSLENTKKNIEHQKSYIKTF